MSVGVGMGMGMGRAAGCAHVCNVDLAALATPVLSTQHIPPCGSRRSSRDPCGRPTCVPPFHLRCMHVPVDPADASVRSQMLTAHDGNNERGGLRPGRGRLEAPGRQQGWRTGGDGGGGGAGAGGGGGGRGGAIRDPHGQPRVAAARRHGPRTLFVVFEVSLRGQCMLTAIRAAPPCDRCL